MEPKKVTVYMPTAGHCDLRPAVLSVLNQDYPNFELIIVDDTEFGLENLNIRDLTTADNRVTVIKNHRKKGACGARNSAIDTATGYFITGIDDDDLMLPGRISAMVYAWEDSCALVFCGHIRRYANREQVVPAPSGMITPTRILHRNIIGNQILTRIDYLRNTDLFDEALPAYQDFDMWVRLMRKYGNAKAIRLNNYVFSQIGSSRISKSRSRRKSAWLRFVRKHRPWITIRHRQSLCLLAYKEQMRQPSLRMLCSFANCSNWRLVALFLRRRIFGR